MTGELGVVSIEKPGKRATVLAYLLLGLGMPLLDVFLALALGMPTPVIHDEFSYLFMADTFALGRVVNPEHPLSQFFQTFHIIQHNGIYVSKYFPGIGLQLLIGKLLGHPMIGVWLTIGLFGASLLFFLRHFFSPRVALIVSVICDMQFMVLSYFGHSYWGGSLIALAGVWSLGGAVLAVKSGQLRYSWVSAAGMVICLLTRPFGGFFYLLPLAGWQLLSLLRRFEVFDWRWSWRLIAPMMIGVCCGFLALGIYNQCVTGSWTTLPYKVYEKFYAPYGVLFLGEHATDKDDNSFFESLPQPFRQMRDRYIAEKAERGAHFFLVKLRAACEIITFFLPCVVAWMFIAAFACKAHWKNWLWRLCALTVAMRSAPLLLSWSSTQPHYSAVWIFPVAVIGAFGLQWLFSEKFTRPFALIASTASLAWLVIIYILSFDSHANLSWKSFTSYQSGLVTRSAVETYLENLPQKSLVFVQYGADHNVDSEWVYNSPQIDAQKIVWAHGLGDENQRLINYYPNRNVWRVIVVGCKATLERWNKSASQFTPIKTFD
jgi:hypothetical protein